MITKAVNLWLGSGPRVVIPVSQFDTAWEFVFSIISAGTEWAIPAGANAVLNGRKPDNNVFAFAGTIANNKITVDCDVQMTAVAGDTICELSIFTTEGSEESQRAKVVGTANFVLAVEAAPNSTGATPSASDLDAYGAIISGELDTYFEQHPEMIGGKGLSEPIRLAILNCFQHVAWIDEHGQNYYDTLYDLLMTRNVLSITAVFDQGSAVILDTDSLNTLKQYLTVTANYDDGTSGTVTTYTLSGTLVVGTSTITVSYLDKTTTFTVVVSNIPAEYQEVEYVGFDGNCRIVTSAGIDTNAEFICKARFNTPTSEHAVACLANTTYSTQSIEITSGTLNRTFFYVSASLAITSISGLYTHPSDIHVKYEDGVKTDYWLTNNGTDYHAEGTQTQLNPQLFADCVFIVGNARTNAAKYGFSGDVYSMKYIKAGTLAVDLVPCYRKADSVIGFYDKVTNAFLTNSGSGTLTKGSDVA